MPIASRYLSARALRGLVKLGDVYAPGSGPLPRFSTCGCLEHIDDVLDHMPVGDRADLSKLLIVVSLLPSPVVALFLRWLEGAPSWRGPGAPLLRFLRMGVKGLVMTLYYSGRVGQGFSGQSTHQALGYQVGVYTGDLPGATGPPAAGAGTDGAAGLADGSSGAASV